MAMPPETGGPTTRDMYSMRRNIVKGATKVFEVHIGSDVFHVDESLHPFD